MTISNGYCALADIKEHLQIPPSDAQDDMLLERAVEASSRSIDSFCGRKFSLDSVATARTFLPSSPTTLIVPDIGTLTGLVVKTDENDDGTFETTLSGYQTEPAYISNRPIELVRLVDGTTFPSHRSGRYSIQVTAKWGYPSVPVEIEQACLILAARIFKRKNSPEGVLAFADSGIIRVSTTDRDVTALISAHRKLQVF